MRYPSVFVARVRQLAEDHDDGEIADSLVREGLKSATGKRFTVEMIRWVRFKHRIAAPARPTGTLRVNDVARRYGINPSVVYYWIEIGVIAAQRRKPGVPYAITITDDADRDLRERIANSSRIKPSFQNATARGAV